MATKRTDLKTDEIKLDDDLDFGDFSMSEIDSQINPEVKAKESRNPVNDVFRGTIEGAASKFQDPAFLARVTKESLPTSYGTIFSVANQAAGTASSLYDEAVKELKPQLSRIAKKVDKLVPDDSRLKKFSKSFVEKTDDGSSRYLPPDRSAIEDQSITQAIGSIFEQQSVQQEHETVKQNARDQIQQEIEQKRFKSNFGLLTSIAESSNRVVKYTEGINQAYQKKSLELQFRSYFTQTQLLDVTKRYYELFRNQNEAVVKNTALPEFVKLKYSERFHEMARNKFMDSMQNSFFGPESAIGKGLKRMKDDAMNFVKGIKDGLEAATFGLDAVEELQETNKMLMELGEKPITMAQLAGAQAGEWAANKIGDKAAAILKPRLEKNKKISDFGNKAGNILVNPQGAIRDYRDTDKYQERLSDEGLKGTVARSFDKLLDYFTGESPDMKLTETPSLTDLNKVALYDCRTERLY